LLLRPHGLAGKPRETVAGVACIAALVAIFVAELVTPDVLISSLALVPLLVAMWALAQAWAVRVGVLATALLTAAIVIEDENRLSLIVLGLTMLVVALVTRIYAQRLAAILASYPNQKSRSRTRPVPASLQYFDRSARGLSGLTPRELEVASLASIGCTAAQIAVRLHISERTVESHIASTYERLGIHSRFELMQIASDLDRYGAGGLRTNSRTGTEDRN
jgi:DNA-binding NarL/FixJ family response regulator